MNEPKWERLALEGMAKRSNIVDQTFDFSFASNVWPFVHERLVMFMKNFRNNFSKAKILD